MSPWLSRKRIFETLMSGKSSFSSSITSQIERSRSRTSAKSAPCEEHELELADLEFVAVAQRGLLDPVAVHVGAVQRADVPQQIVAAAPGDLGVAARDGD